MKKRIINATVIAIAIFLIILIYFNQYSIKNNKESIEIALADFMMDIDLKYSQLDDSNSDTLEIKKMEHIGDRTIVFLSYQRDGKELFAYAKLKKGLNGRYEILSTGHASGRTFLTTDLKTNQKTFRIIMGENFEREISSFKLKYDGYEFSSVISGEDYFIKYFEIPEHVSKFDELILFDQENNDITDEIREKYPVEKGGGTTTLMEEGLIETILYGIIIFITYAIMRYVNDKSKEKE
ncbi:MAG: hypothetical protein MJA31_03785 [Clostridia bacterium]|nr:hypothetical protein [Clostridia bacterium]